MPRVTLYIRNEDMTLWNNLDNKAEAVSNMLRGKHIPVTQPTPVVEPLKASQPIYNTRTVVQVLKDIEKCKQEYAERLQYCQDADTTTSIETECKDTLDALWAEYNSLKASL